MAVFAVIGNARLGCSGDHPPGSQHPSGEERPKRINPPRHRCRNVFLDRCSSAARALAPERTGIMVVLYIFGGHILIVVCLCVDDVLALSNTRTEEVVTGYSDLRALSSEYQRRALSQSQPLPIYVPTGVFVQSITFLGANDVKLTGYIWQKYTDGVHDGVSRGFVMPEYDAAEI